jgi:hypothetical protein
MLGGRRFSSVAGSEVRGRSRNMTAYAFILANIT